MGGAKAQAVVCIGDSQPWLDNIALGVQTAGASTPRFLSWDQFDSAPMDFAQPNCLAYAHLAGEIASVDIRLGKLCRSFPFGVLLELADEVTASDQHFFAHGFQKIGALGEKMTALEGEELFLNPAERCFQFRLEDYKAVPDWLNTRFWAHPERFHL